MDDAEVHKFASRLEFEALLRDCLARSHISLQLFDPDFAVFALGAADVDAALRRFLAGGGTIRLAFQRSAHIERHYPRFLRLLREFGHRIECRVTPKRLNHLTDSFCIGDGVHIVRRFHSEHMRGEAAFASPAATDISLERFGALWLESASALHPDTTGL